MGKSFDHDFKEIRATKYYREDLSNVTGTIGKGCVIHSHVWIGDKVVIGNNVKIQAFSFIPNGVTIEDNVFIGPHVVFTNDKVPPNDQFKPTTVRNGASIGANSTIICGVTIGNGALIGAGSVVTKDIPIKATAYGNPAKIFPHVWEDYTGPF